MDFFFARMDGVVAVLVNRINRFVEQMGKPIETAVNYSTRPAMYTGILRTWLRDIRINKIHKVNNAIKLFKFFFYWERLSLNSKKVYKYRYSIS